MTYLSRIALPAALLAAVATSLTGAAQNLIENPSFDSNGGSWTEGSRVDAVHRDDVGSTLVGGSGPGALEIQFRYWHDGCRVPHFCNPLCVPFGRQAKHPLHFLFFTQLQSGEPEP